jgi:hypothetical protein
MTTKNKCIVVAVSVPADIAAQLRAESNRVGLSLSRLIVVYCKSRIGAKIVNGEVES